MAGTLGVAAVQAFQERPEAFLEQFEDEGDADVLGILFLDGRPLFSGALVLFVSFLQAIVMAAIMHCQLDDSARVVIETDGQAVQLGLCFYP